ncbi:MAG: MFS transporter [Deltaproteobacteria bacterium]|nr:MFS transporter [Deltaproteobacteria bacterium]
MRGYLNLPRQVWLLAVGQVINRAGALLIPFLAVYLRDHLRLSTEAATLAVGAWGLGSIFGSLAGGQLADAWSRRGTMLVSLFGSAGIMLGYAYLTSAPAVIAGTFLLALVADLFRPASSAMIADLVDEHQRGPAYALMYTAVNLGFTMAPVIGGYLLATHVHLVFWGDAGTTCLFGLMVLVAVPDTLPHHTVREPAAPLRDALVDMFHNRRFVLFCTGALLTGFVFMQHIATLPLHMTASGMAPQVYGRTIALNGAIVVLLQLPVAQFAARLPRGATVAAASIIVGAGFGLTAFAWDAWTFAATIAVWSLGEVLQMPFMQAIVADLAPTQFRGRYLGVFSLSFSVANTVATPLGGVVLARLGGNFVWGACAVTGLLSALFFHAATRKAAAGTAARSGAHSGI